MDPIEACLKQHLLPCLSTARRESSECEPAENQRSNGRVDVRNSPNSAILIAFSGGLDSSVLLHATVNLWQQGVIGKPVALHFNHGLQVDSTLWAEDCEKRCAAYKIQLIIGQGNLAQQDTTNEQDARQARYQFFESVIQPQQQLLMAHHQDDQAETLLFRLIRGSGLLGMQGMKLTRPLGVGLLSRPLLNIAKSQIRNYAIKNNLQWVEDPSNQSADFDRNYIRNQLVPQISQRWNAASKNISQFGQIVKAQNELLIEIAQQDLDLLSSGNKRINWRRLLSLSSRRMKNFLHYWITMETGLPPSYAQISQVLQQLHQVKLASGESKGVKIKVGKGCVRQFKEDLYLTRIEFPSSLSQTLTWDSIKETMQLSKSLELACLSASQQHDSVDFQRLSVRPPLASEVVTIRARSGGEKIQWAGRKFHSRLKNIYQQLNTPHWERCWRPIIYYNDKIVAIPDVVVDEAFASQQGDAIIFKLKFK